MKLIYLIFSKEIETVTDIITSLASSHKKGLQNHIDSEMSRLLNVQNIPDDSNGRNRLNQLNNRPLRASVEVA
jgi:hypothetical protein